MKATQVCTIEGCGRALGRSSARGLCNVHYLRMRTSGELPLLPARSPAERLAAKLVRTPNGCLEYTGYRRPFGYGQIGVEGKIVAAHRLAWILVNGPIPNDLWVLHHCDNPPCCQTDQTPGYPDGHLFLGTPADNAADRNTKGRNGIMPFKNGWHGVK
jgi:HNH endonuclease